MSGSNSWLLEAIQWGVYPPSSGGGGGTVTELQVQRSAFNYAPATGADDAFVVVLNPAVTNLTNNLLVSMSSGTLQNLTSSPTLKVNALSPVPITLWGGLALAPNDISPNTAYLFVYDLTGNTFQLINPSVSAANTFLLQENFYNSAIDVGSANAFSITLIPAPQSSYGEGFPVYMRAGGGHTNTGASTLTVNGTTDPIVLQNGDALPANTILANGSYWFLWSTNLSSWVIQNPPVLLLNPSATQTISGGFDLIVADTGNIQASSGNIIAGASAAPGSLISYPPTASSGTLQVSASDSTGAFDGIVTNDGLTANRTWVLPNLSGDIALVGATSSIVLQGDSGSITGAVLTIETGVATNNSGSTITFDNTGSTSILSVTDPITGSTCVGSGTGNIAMTGDINTLFGAGTGYSLTSGLRNIAVGTCIQALTTGSYNHVMGVSALNNVTSGSYNIAIGYLVANQVAGSSSNNIIFNASGIVGDNNTLRIGEATGTGTQELNAAYIQGIHSNTQDPTSINQYVTINNTTGLLGVTSNNGSNNWIDQTTSPATLAVNTGYTSNAGPGTITFNLPATSAVGDWIEINGGTSQWQIAQAAGQQIQICPDSTTLGATGLLFAQTYFVNVRIRCIVANTIWTVVSQQSTGLGWN